MSYLGSSRLQAVESDAQATAIGEARMDIQPEITGNPPQGVLECVFSSMLQAAEMEAEDRHWAAPEGRIIRPSPSIPLLGSREEMLNALFDGCGNELMIPETGGNLLFGKPVNDAHVYVRNNADALKGFFAVGGQPRVFGDKTMIPGFTDLREFIEQKHVTSGATTAPGNDNVAFRPKKEARTQSGVLKAAA